MSDREPLVTLYGSRPTVQGGMECPLPRMVQVEQRFLRPRVADIPAALAASVKALPIKNLAGKRVAMERWRSSKPFHVSASRPASPDCWPKLSAS